MILHTHINLCECVCRYCTECLQYWMVLLLNLNATDPKTAPTQQFRARNYTYYWFSPPAFYYYRHLLLLLLAGARNNFSLRARVSILIIIFIIINCFSLRKGTNWFFFLLSSGCFFFSLNAVVVFFLFATCNILRSLETFPIIILDLFFFCQPSETKLNNLG